jgi:hypothetical protein
MASNNRYRPYVSSKGPQQSPHQPDPPEGNAPLERMADEREAAGGPLQVPEPAPGLDDPDTREYRQGRSDPTAEGAGGDGGDDDQSDEDEDDEDDEKEPDWKARGQAAYRTSTDFMDSNFRKPLEDSLRAFNNQHPQDSKYNSETFRKRSHLYRPKIRSINRKNEAALCAALFSNLDLIECSATNPTKAESIAGAEVMQALLQERLTVSMPWFQFAMGSVQDAQVQGVVICHSFWKYAAAGRGHEYAIKKDQPCQELVALENFRFDPCAQWYDVVGTSPFLIHIIPMYIGAVRERMTYPDPKGHKWKNLTDEEIAACVINDDESTRAARNNFSQDPTQQPREVTDYDVVWVQRHIHKWRGEDYEFYMLGDQHMLTKPEPLVANVWFGERPYVIGTCAIETHKPVPTSMNNLLRPLADEANDLQNQSSDNMKFILNKRWLVKRGQNVDTAGMTRNVAGGVTMVNDVEKDVKEISWPDLPASLQAEKQRNDADFDALGGNFNPMQIAQTRTPRESFRTINAVQSPAMMMTEYTLMTLVQTFLLPVLRQLVLLEQYYETDQVLLATVGEKAKIFQRFNVDKVTDAMLTAKMAVNVNLGMGATDPAMKQQRLAACLQQIQALAAKPVPGLDLKEIFKELFALAGYRDGLRFLQEQADPQVAAMAKTIQALMKKLSVYEVKDKNREREAATKLTLGREGNITKLALASKEDDHQSRHLLIGHMLEMEKISTQQEHQSNLQAEGAAQSSAQQAMTPPPGQAAGAGKAA